MSRRSSLTLATLLAALVGTLTTTPTPSVATEPGARPVASAAKPARVIGAALTGRVVDATTGAPVAGIEVYANPVIGGVLQQLGGGTTTGADGTYTIAYLRGATYVVQFRGTDTLAAAWWYDGATARSATRIHLDPGQWAHLADTALEHRLPSLGGRLLDQDGAPLAGQHVVATSGGYGAPGDDLEAVTDGAGRWSVTPHYAGDYAVYFPGDDEHPGHYLGSVASDDRDPDVVTIPSGAAVVTDDGVLGPGGTVRGSVTRSDTGAPVAGVGVSLTVGQVQSATRTDSDGRWSLQHTPIGAGYLSVGSTADTVAPYPGTDVEVGAGTTTVAPLVVDPEGSIAGRVVDDDGNPLVDVRVHGAGPDNVYTDADGRYTFEDVRPGDYRLIFDKRPTYAFQWWGDAVDDTSAATVHVAPGQHRTDVDATLHRGASISGTISVPGGGPVPRAGVYAVVDSAIVRVASAAPDGTYTIDQLPPGDYTLIAYAEGWAATYWGEVVLGGPRPPLTVTPGQEVRSTDITMQAGYPLTGTVETTAGAAAHRTVSVLDLDHPQPLPFADDRRIDSAFGAFSVDHLRPGHYRVVARCDSYDESSRPVDVTVGPGRAPRADLVTRKGQGRYCYPPPRAERPVILGRAEVGRTVRVRPPVHTDQVISYAWWVGRTRLDAGGTKLLLLPSMRGRRIHVTAALVTDFDPITTVGATSDVTARVR